ncbi:4659_t:CDS:2 [Funneliformis caledonium]|uniref:4659_t:CDS:1 n=1 Tax=Funneliformis caledonium TaxID=1117310 RepID=A0A9N9BVS2_9GLOM|nr:4659_t:CDS:2 [Funneliformis caledonium]
MNDPVTRGSANTMLAFHLDLTCIISVPVFAKIIGSPLTPIESINYGILSTARLFRAKNLYGPFDDIVSINFGN